MWEEEMSIFSVIYQWIEAIRMLVSPDTPLICLASLLNLAMLDDQQVLERCA